LKKSSFSFDLIIPAFNAEATLESCLKSALALKEDYPLLKILVVDNNSTDNTSLIAQQLGVRVLLCPKQGRAAARNFGLNNTDSKFVAFVDSDMILPKNWPQSLQDVFTQESIGAAQAMIIPGPGNSFVDRYSFSFKNRMSKGHFIESEFQFADQPLIDTAASMYRRTALEKIKGFDESLAMQEDRDCAIRLIASGYSLRTSFQSQTFKQSNRTPWQFTIRTIEDAKVLARYTVQHTEHILIYHLLSVLFQPPRYFDPQVSLVIFLYGQFIFFLNKFFYLYFYTYFFLQKLPKTFFPMQVSKLNLLLPRIRHPQNGSLYIFSPHYRFFISPRSLIIYKAGKLPTRYEDPGLVDWFNKYLDNKLLDGAEIHLQLIEDEVFIPETKSFA
jgi:glycosyltransferase involved in cell wall biosynthesis